MFTEYYYLTHHHRHIYYSLRGFENRVEVSLYIDNKLVVRKSVFKGVHLIQHDDIEIQLNVTLLKTSSKLKIAGEDVAIKKIKRKDLRSILNELGIFNEINPRPAAREPFNFRKLILPVALIALGVVLQVLTKGMGKFWDIPSMIVLIIAYFGLFSSLAKRIPENILDDANKGKLILVFSFGFMILTQVLISELIY
jgi:hypothetical protein